eukprot:TRINITY_DN111_c0_g1_i2.p1 TRINITY_DN111_c0_g1~~TRINITY_DN111_c0_g1_i2.p1  ORF type:complete len:811 (+),score=221.01 TRINITY_DN111_c0_g1_i2:95-2527(+)
MEVHVESAEGNQLPPDCYIGVRVGEVLKQGRYEPQRSYNFPQLQQRRNAKIDVYQHIGSCVVSVDPDTKSIHEVKVVSSKPEYPGTTLKVSVQSRSDENSKQQREDRKKALKNHSKDYLAKHSIEERLAEAVKALLKEQPEDATHFLCKSLGGLTALEAEVDALRRTNDELRKELEAVKPQLAEKDRALAEARKTAAAEQLDEHERALRETNRIAEDKVNALQETNRIAEDKVNALQETHRIAEDKVNALQETHRIAEDKINELQNNLAISVQEIETLKPALAKAEKCVADQQKQLAESEQARRESRKFAEEKIEALKKEIDALKSATASNAAIGTTATPAPPASAKTADMAELRRQAANILKSANDDGKLGKVLMEVRGPPISRPDAQQPGQEAIRLKAAAILTEAADNGTLGKVLLETKGAASDTEKPRQGPDVNDVRMRAGGLLKSAAEDGRLGSALKEIKKPAAQPKQEDVLLETKGAATDTEKPRQGPDVNDVRMRAGGLLKSAAEDGRLGSALKEIKKPAAQPKQEVKKDDVRMKAANLLLQAGENGHLEAALREIKAETSKRQDVEVKGEESQRQAVENVRLKAQKLLLQAGDDGSLQTILRDLSKPNEDTERIRTKAAALLLQAEENGNLEGALREVKGESTHSQGVSCHVCGNVYMDDALFCRKCGTKRPESCESCGNVFMEDAVFCRKCGTKRPGGAPAANEAPASVTKAASTSAPGSAMIEDVRMKASNLLNLAADNGDLKRILREVKDEKSQNEQKDEVKDEHSQDKKRVSPPLVMSSIDTMTGSYNAAGVQPGLMFI